ncbi:rRNA maturation RNase YbeY, partial [bacterium]
MSAALQLDVTRTGRTNRTGGPSRRLLEGWALAALGRRAGAHEVALRLVGPAESRRLNRHYRG